jgi:hypothetical protein
MHANEDFQGRGRKFWSYVRLVSEQTGYQPHGDELVKEYDAEDLQETVKETGINAEPILGGFSEQTTNLGNDVLNYLNYRSKQVEVALDKIRPRDQAMDEFEEFSKEFEMDTEQLNKQGSSQPLIFANSVNLVLEKETGVDFNPNPRMLPTVLDEDKDLQMTLPKWPDGAFPTARNPRAIWEVKEFYSSTSFGSRIADAIYEIMLFHEELSTLHNETGQEIELYLMTDGYEAWQNGVSYICRIIDILNMGYIDATIFGEEVFTQWPDIVDNWNELPSQ